jgi:hypothetical protein
MIRPRTLGLCIPSICCAAIAYGQQIPQVVVLPPVNLAAGETAQVGIMSSAGSYPGGTFVTTCQGSFTFYGADGSALGGATNFIVGNTRQVFSAELPYALTGADGLSTAVSAQIALTPAPSSSETLAPPIPFCAVAFSLETLDTETRVTHAFVTGWAVQGSVSAIGSGVASVLPCVDAAFFCVLPQTVVLPPVNLAATETARIRIMSSAAGYPGNAFVTNCKASLTFYGADGSPLGAATNFSIGNSGQIFSVELPYASTGANGLNTAVSAQITLAPDPFTASTLAPPIPPCAVAFSLETYDTQTGITHAFVSGKAAKGEETTTSRLVPNHRRR